MVRPLIFAALVSTAFAQTPGSATNQTVLKTVLVNGTVTVSLNGKRLGDYTSVLTLDVSNRVKTCAENVLKVTRAPGDDTPPQGTVGVSFAAKKNQFRTLAEAEFGVLTPLGAGKTIRFQVPCR